MNGSMVVLRSSKVWRWGDPLVEHVEVAAD
jgi:hypothetical protein